MKPEKDQFKIKPPKTYKEQIEIYKSRNLYIKDSEYAEKILQRVNYYRLSDYGLTMKEPVFKNQYSGCFIRYRHLLTFSFLARLSILLEVAYLNTWQTVVGSLKDFLGKSFLHY